MSKPTYSGLLERLMTEEEMKAQEKYLRERSAEVQAKAHKEAEKP